MSNTCLWNPVARPDKSGWDLVVETVQLGQTCLVQEPDMFDRSYWNLDKPG
jgi:hypothetical protein